MPKSSEEISKYNANSAGRPDSNLANDSNHLGGIPAEDYATKDYVHKYHDTKEASLKDYIDEQDEAKLAEAKAYVDQAVGGQDFSGFAKTTDVQALDTKLSKQIEDCHTNCHNELETRIAGLVKDTNGNFEDVGKAIESLTENLQQEVTNLNRTITEQDEEFSAEIEGLKKADSLLQQGITSLNGSVDTLNEKTENLQQDITGLKTSVQGLNQDVESLRDGQNDLFQSVSDGKSKIAGAITDKGIFTSATDTYDTMASNIRNIKTDYGDNFVDTSDADATSGDILLGKSAYAQGTKIYGTHVCQGIDTSDATATPYDILQGKTAYVGSGKIEGLLTPTTDDSDVVVGFHYDIGAVEKIYASKSDYCKETERKLPEEFNGMDASAAQSAQVTAGYYASGYYYNGGKMALIVMKTSKGLKLISVSDGYKIVVPGRGELVSTYTPEELGIEGLSMEAIYNIEVSDLSITTPYLVLSVSKNGSHLYLYPIKYDNYVYTLDIENKKEAKLATTSSVQNRPQLYISDDGSRLACMTNPSNSFQSAKIDIYEVFSYTLDTLILSSPSMSGSIYFIQFITNNLIVAYTSKGATIIVLDEEKFTSYSKSVTGGVLAVDGVNGMITQINDKGTDVHFYWNDVNIDYDYYEDKKDADGNQAQRITVTQTKDITNDFPNEIIDYINTNSSTTLVSCTPIGSSAFLLRYDSAKTYKFCQVDSTLKKIIPKQGLSNVSFSLGRPKSNGNVIFCATKSDYFTEISVKEDYSTLVALKYNGEYFYRQAKTI